MTSKLIKIPSQTFILYSGVDCEEENDLDSDFYDETTTTLSSTCTVSSESLTQDGLKIITGYDFGSTFITKLLFGHLIDPKTQDSQEVYLYDIENSNRMHVKLLTYGARVHDIIVPDRNGDQKSVVLNVPTLNEYKNCEEKYLNSTIGRTSGLVKDARFCINGNSFDLSENYKNGYHFNGGATGAFNSRLWLSEIYEGDVLMTLISHDGDEGYPGSVIAQARFSLGQDNTFQITYTARTTQSTPMDISNRIFLNLSGDKEERNLSLYDHSIQINADLYAVRDGDTDLIDTNLKNVTNTEYDLRTLQTLGVAMKRHPMQGFDNLYKVVKSNDHDLNLVARLIHPISGIAMECYTNQDFVWFNTLNHLPDPDGTIYPDYDLELLELEPFPLKVSEKNEESTVKSEQDKSMEESLGNEPTSLELDQLKVSKRELNLSTEKTNSKENGPKKISVTSDHSQRLFTDPLPQTSTHRPSESSPRQQSTSKSVRSSQSGVKPIEPISPKHSEFTLHGSTTNIDLRCEDSKLSQVEGDSQNNIEQKTEVVKPHFLKNAGFYIQVQNFPDAVNHQKLFPSVILHPGHLYTNETLFKFGVHTGVVEEREGKKSIDSNLNSNEDEGEILKYEDDQKPNPCCKPDCPRRFLKMCCLYCEKHCKKN